MNCVIDAPVATATTEMKIPAEVKVERTVFAPTQSFPVPVNAGLVNTVISLGGTSISAIPRPAVSLRGDKGRL